MKSTFFLYIAICFTNILFAQNQNYKIAIDNFQTDFNSEKYDSIFKDFSTEMKSALPLENTRQFLKGLKTQVGKILEKEFVNDENGTEAIYKTQFEELF